MEPVLQSSLPFAPWMLPHTRRMPGTQPMDPADWLRVDDAYAGQMALRDRLIAERLPLVHGVTPQGRAAADELYAKVMAEELPRLGFSRDGDCVTRPDGVTVLLDAAQPLVTLGRLFQNDFCIMEEDGQGEHLLSAAILCFPAGWTLAEKLGRPMMRIHQPVAKYDADIGRRVQRLLDGLQPGRAIWRANAHHSRAPLFNPLAEDHGKDMDEGAMPWIRSERQCLLRLPDTRAIVFSIHTYLVRIEDLTPEQAAGLRENPIHRAA
ncbi:MAG: DUF3445 domain-containing protein [Paracoccaceae bacterium]